MRDALGCVSARFMSDDPASDMSYDRMAGKRHVSWPGQDGTMPLFGSLPHVPIMRIM